ncbi:hypothetical protein BOX15_Mlig014569g1 [Macrostomum lignano]|uniref:RING-type domain-containing protein n=1 Tax=Macrostomum lignano TaxID=282301 RepID=A0A267EEM4_9PLAT|nr:hypothetical protein BOX15_Mlig014569g1 [Macrostomum lignano]
MHSSSCSNIWRPLLLLHLLLAVLTAPSGADSHSGRGDVSQRPEFMSAHYQRTRQLQDEFRLSFDCEALAKPHVYDVDPPPRTSSPAVQPAGSDRLSWLRRKQAETHILSSDAAALLAVAVSPPCTRARLISPTVASSAAAAAEPTVALADVKACGLVASIQAVRRLLPDLGLLLVFNAPAGSARSYEEDAAASSTAARPAATPAGAIISQAHPPPPPPPRRPQLPVVLYEPADLAARLLDELQRSNRSCKIGYSFRSVAPDGLINKTSVLFVSVSFILLMVISLSWLIFYYVQRFRYLHAKERLSRRLGTAAKKALTKIPVKVLKTGDKDFDWIGDQCAVCIEPYRCGESVRILPCRHFYHKSCIDPWLLDQRSCPLCKLDILKACGLHIHRGSQASLLDAHLLAEHSHHSHAAANPAGATVPSGVSASAAASVAGSVQVPTLLIQAGSGGRDSAEASPSNSHSDEGGVQVTIEPPDVQYHHSNDSSVQCGPLACRHDSASSDASSAGAAADGAAGHQRLALVKAAEVCYPLVHRHHGSG